jgi:thymidylate kinase
MKESWNISGLILEGICGTGKTTLLRALVQSARFTRKTFLSSIVLSEHQTQRVLERKEREQGLAVADNLTLLDQHVSCLESMHERLDQMPWRANNRTNMRVVFLLERFHLTHVYHYSYMSWDDVKGIDARLAKLNCKLCLLTMDNSIFKKRIIDSRDSAWREYLGRHGDSDDEILDHYRKQQEYLRRLCQKTALNVSVCDTTNMSVDETVGQVLDFWGVV